MEEFEYQTDAEGLEHEEDMFDKEDGSVELIR